MLYGNSEGYQLHELTMKQLDRKIKLCQDYMSVMDVVEPGYSPWRGRMLEEVAKAKVERIRRQMEQGKYGKVEVMMEYKKVMKLLKESGKCRQFEPSREQQEFASRVKNLLMH